MRIAASVRVCLAFFAKDKEMNNDTKAHSDALQYQDDQDAIPDGARHIDDALNEALDESFPARDPIAVTTEKTPQRPVINLRWIEERRLVKAESRPSERQEK
jgi:hypothetical protein